MSQRLEEREDGQGRRAEGVARATRVGRAGRAAGRTAVVEPLGSSPDYRWNAVPSADRVNVVADEVSWEGPSGSGAGGSGGARQAAARLTVTVQVREVPPATRVWLDVYAFDADGGLVSFDTHDLQHSEAGAGEQGGGELFVLDAPVWDAPLGVRGAMPAPMPRKLKYRVYVRPEAGLFTDGLLHDLTLPHRSAGRSRKRVPQMTPRSQQVQS